MFSGAQGSGVLVAGSEVAVTIIYWVSGVKLTSVAVGTFPHPEMLIIIENRRQEI
jgi:hypothetical protein